MRGSSTFHSFNKTRKQDVEWAKRQNELNESMLQGGKAFWPMIQLVSGKKIGVGAAPFQRRVIVQLEKHEKTISKNNFGHECHFTNKRAEVTLEVYEWRAFLKEMPLVKDFIKTAENAGDKEAVPDFLTTRLGAGNLYDWGTFGGGDKANIVKYRLGSLNLVMMFVWANKEEGKAPNCTVALGRGFICKDSGKMAARANQSVYLSGAALDYLFTEKLDVIKNAIRAWSDMIKFSGKLIYSCKPGYDPSSITASSFKDEAVERRVPVQEQRLMTEMHVE